MEHQRNETATAEDLSGRDARNRRRVVLWSAAWAVSLILASLAIVKEWFPLPATVLLVVGTAALGVITLLAYRRFLRATDELRRKIEVEALALAFGVGVVGGMTYWLLVVAGAAPQSGFGFVFAGMILVHPVGVVLGRRRYS